MKKACLSLGVFLNKSIKEVKKWLFVAFVVFVDCSKGFVIFIENVKDVIEDVLENIFENEDVNFGKDYVKSSVTVCRTCKGAYYDM